MEDYRCRLLSKKDEDVKKWILRVKTYTAARGWNNNKMAAMAAIGLPDDKVESVLLTVPEEDRKDWPKLKKATLDEYRSDRRPLSRRFFPGSENQANLFWFILLFWSDYIVRSLASRRVQHSMRRHRKQLLASFFEEFLSPYLQNCY